MNSPQMDMVFITDFEMLQEAMALETFSSRGQEVYTCDYMIKIRGGGKASHGLTGSEGPHGKEKRRFTMKHLKDLGSGRSSMEEIIGIEFDEIAKKLRLSGGKEDISIHLLFNVTVINVLWRIIAGSRFDMNNPEAVKRMEELEVQSHIKQGLKVYH